jgi:hypothetical protein
LHCSGLTFFWEDGEGWLSVINVSTVRPLRGNLVFPELAIFCGGELKDVKYP